MAEHGVGPVRFAERLEFVGIQFDIQSCDRFVKMDLRTADKRPRPGLAAHHRRCC